MSPPCAWGRWKVCSMVQHTTGGLPKSHPVPRTLLQARGPPASSPAVIQHGKEHLRDLLTAARTNQCETILAQQVPRDASFSEQCCKTQLCPLACSYLSLL